MKHFERIIISILVFWALLALLSSYIIYNEGSNQSGKGYNIDINRINYELSHGVSASEINLSQYTYVKDIQLLGRPFTSDQLMDFFRGTDVPIHMQYKVMPLLSGEEVTGYIRYMYESHNQADIHKILLLYNIFLALITTSVIILLYYIRKTVLKPFHEIVELPYELSQGHLVTGIKETKSRFFGKFLWGLDLLRENLEAHKQKELQLEKEKKTMILSISHDIKTPVSTIKLYAKALYDNLYDSEGKRKEISRKIEEKADQIESFVSEIIAASTSNVIDIQVDNGEFYLSQLMNKLQKAYDDKFKLLLIDFLIEPYEDILLKGDVERLVEVFENLFENAIKYGDGKKISISFGEEDYCKLITVTNTGVPIAETEFVHIFESFWRGSNAQEKPGNGLGLYICKEIMKKMDGDIFAQSSSDSMGITVVVRYSE